MPPQALQGPLFPEARRRVEETLGSGSPGGPPEHRRGQRGVEVLEHIASARTLLRRLAAGASLRREARESVQRLTRWTPSKQ